MFESPGRAVPQILNMTTKVNPSDVESIDAIIAAAYDVILGPAGQPRDWERERSLFYPGARFIPTATVAGRNDVELAPLILDVAGYIARVEPLFEEKRVLRKRDRPPRRIFREHRARLEHVNRITPLSQ